jgi:hypothetical protein
MQTTVQRVQPCTAQRQQLSLGRFDSRPRRSSRVALYEGGRQCVVSDRARSAIGRDRIRIEAALDEHDVGAVCQPQHRNRRKDVWGGSDPLVAGTGRTEIRIEQALRVTLSAKSSSDLVRGQPARPDPLPELLDHLRVALEDPLRLVGAWTLLGRGQHREEQKRGHEERPHAGYCHRKHTLVRS